MDYIQRYLVEELAEDYQDGRMTESEFLRRLALFTRDTSEAMSLAVSLGYEPGRQATAAAVMDRPLNQQAPSGTGITVQPDDPATNAEMIEFPGDEGLTLFGYLARPRQEGVYPGILLVHENRGLWPPHYQDVTRRYAKEGYVTLAVDLLSREGGTAKFNDPADANAALGRLNRDQFVADMNAAVRHLQSLPYVRRDRIGATGFCFGGGMVWLLTVRNPDIVAAAPYYGAAPPLEEVPYMKAAVLGIYGGNDERINAGVPALEEALKEHHKTYKFITYSGAEHAFFNDTGGPRHHPQASSEAWRETLAWFGEHLKNG
jgi:carboxymethylenebutenolidase